jgi:two-component system CheB/CheR fusion protein
MSIKREETGMGDSAATGGQGSIKSADDNAFSQCGERLKFQESPCFVVGIGASAGGQEPLEHIFTTLPPNCNLSFVVVMHLPPDGPSLLADLLSRFTTMQVLTAEDGALLQPNSVHVNPPGTILSVSGGRLRIERETGWTAGTTHPIDRFFASLASDYGERAIAVVLSGFGTDGAEGVKRISEKGGSVLVQAPETAVNPPMPANAVATGVASMILPMEEIPLKLAEIARGNCKLPQKACLTTTIDEDLNSIFTAVKTKTGQDFSSYKRNTVLRRIERRMAVNESGGLKKYLSYLEQNPNEAQALAQEILIGVTRFFRDPEAFEVLRSELIPRLFAGRDPEDPVRIWHACCATGEEAYSVAILVREHLKKERLNSRVQIFATDIDEAAVAQARAGCYADDIGADIGEERLNTFFTRAADRWQASKELRDIILFASHNILKDPPFSRLDMLVCRNFLIYLNPDMQKRLMSLFHMVLKPGGILFLGASETAGANTELFAPVDKKWKIYQRLESDRREDALFPFTTPVRKLTRATAIRQHTDTEGPTPAEAADRVLVERYSPAGVVVNERYEVLHISSRTRPFLDVPVGAPSLDILKMAREELRPALRAAIYKSFTEDKQVVFRGVKITNEEEASTVNVTVDPLTVHSSFGRLALVILETTHSPVTVRGASDGDDIQEDAFSKEMLIHQMEEQLRMTHEQLRFTTEQLEASNEGFMATNEELMSINEEFQSANEELQSTNEELEASKEELQTLNEELVIVNAELQGKVEELDSVNSDMNNLFSSSEIATIFLDRHLTIKRFSPAMAAILNLIPADIGRPFRHLSGTIDWSNLPNDALTVLEKLSPVEREVSSLEDNRCFIMRVLPYRTMEGNIDGIVVTLVDISELRRAEEAIRSAALFPLENPAPVMRVRRDGTLLFVNRATDPLLSQWYMEFGRDIPEQLLENISAALADGVNREYDIMTGGCYISFNVVPFPERDYVNLYGRDMTTRKQAEEAAQRAREEWERTFDSVPDLIAILDDRHRIVRANRAMAQRLGVTTEECIGRPCYQNVHGIDKFPDFCPHALTMADGLEHAAEVHEEHLGGDFLVTTTPLKDGQGRMVGAVHVARDITERKKMEDALRESESRYRELVQNANSAIIRWKCDGTVTFFNEYAQEFFGYTQEEIIGNNVSILLPGRDSTAGDTSGLVREIAEHPEKYQDNVNENILRDGSIVWMAWTNTPIFDDRGQVAEILSVGMDITERKLAEDALRASNKELERFNRATVGRELRMVELKKEVNELCARLGEQKRYPLDFE